jgi:hypothetical protein
MQPLRLEGLFFLDVLLSLGLMYSQTYSTGTDLLLLQYTVFSLGVLTRDL